MQPTHNSLSENISAQFVELLNKHLAAAIDLHAQVKQAHWNVRASRDAPELHERITMG